MKKLAAVLLGFCCVTTAAFADKDKKSENGVVIVVPTPGILNPESNIPPGLAKKGELPPGLAKKDKIPPGWSKGNKNRGDQKNTVPTVGNLIDKALSD